MKAIQNFISDDTGVTAIEYALIAALVAAVISVGATTLGTSINAMFVKVAGLIK